MLWLDPTLAVTDPFIVDRLGRHDPADRAQVWAAIVRNTLRALGVADAYPQQGRADARDYVLWQRAYLLRILRGQATLRDFGRDFLALKLEQARRA